MQAAIGVCIEMCCYFFVCSPRSLIRKLFLHSVKSFFTSRLGMPIRASARNFLEMWKELQRKHALCTLRPSVISKSLIPEIVQDIGKCYQHLNRGLRDGEFNAETIAEFCENAKVQLWSHVIITSEGHHKHRSALVVGRPARGD